MEKKDRTVNPQGTPAQEVGFDTSVLTAPPTQTALPEPQEGAAAANGSAETTNVSASPPQEMAEAHPQEPAYAADLETLDLTPMISDLANHTGDAISLEQAPVASLPQAFGSEMPTASDSPQVTTERSGTPIQSPVLAQSFDAESTPTPSTHSEISPVPTADPVTPPPGLGRSPSIPASPADRLADAVRDLIQSTLSAEQGVAAERLIKALEDRMARMQLEVLDRVTHQIQSLVSAQTSVLKERADEFNGQSQQVLSIHLKQLAEAADENARAVQSEAASTVERALNNLHDQVAEQLPQTEKKFLDECRTLAEQSLSAIVETSLRTLSLRIAEANRGLEETAERTQKVLLDTSLQLEQQAVTKIDETTKYLEAQLRVVAQRIFSSFQQYTIAELGKKQRTMEVEFQQQMQTVSESSLLEMQGALSRMLEGLAETMRPAPSRGVSDSNSPKGEPTLSTSPVCQTKSAGGES